MSTYYFSNNKSLKELCILFASRIWWVKKIVRGAGSRNRWFVTSGVVCDSSDKVGRDHFITGAVGCAVPPRVLSHLSTVHFFDEKSPIRFCKRWVSRYVRSTMFTFFQNLQSVDPQLLTLRSVKARKFRTFVTFILKRLMTETMSFTDFSKQNPNMQVCRVQSSAKGWSERGSKKV